MNSVGSAPRSRHRGIRGRSVPRLNSSSPCTGSIFLSRFLAIFHLRLALNPPCDEPQTLLDPAPARLYIHPHPPPRPLSPCVRRRCGRSLARRPAHLTASVQVERSHRLAPNRPRHPPRSNPHSCSDNTVKLWKLPPSNPAVGISTSSDAEPELVKTLEVNALNFANARITPGGSPCRIRSTRPTSTC